MRSCDTGETADVGENTTCLELPENSCDEFYFLGLPPEVFLFITHEACERLLVLVKVTSAHDRRHNRLRHNFHFGYGQGVRGNIRRTYCTRKQTFVRGADPASSVRNSRRCFSL